MDGSRAVISNVIEHPNLVFETIDITDSNQVLAYAKKVIPEAVIAPSNDAGIIAATIVAEFFKIPGPGNFATENSRDKFKFRRLLHANGLTTPWFLKVNPLEDFDSIGKIPSFPCVIKPVQGSGSKGVRYLASASDFNLYLSESLARSPIYDLQIEEFIEGVEFSIEGLVQNSHLKILAVCEKQRSLLPNLVDTRVSIPSNISAEQYKLALNITQKIVDVLQVKNAPIHLEFIQSPTRGFVAVECAVRAGGFNLFNRMVPWCTGIDAMDAQLNLILGKPLGNIQPIREFAAILEFPQPSVRGRLKAINYNHAPHEDSQVEIELYKEIGDIVGPPSNGAERIGHIFIFSKTKAQAEKALISLNLSIELEETKSYSVTDHNDETTTHV